MRLSQLGHRTRVTVIGACAVLVTLVAIALAVGGSDTTTSGGAANTTLAPTSVAGAVPVRTFANHSAAGLPRAAVSEPHVAALRASGGAGTAVGSAPSGAGVAPASGGGSAAADDSLEISSGSSLGATRIVKTGDLTIRVPKKTDVQPQTDKLVAIAAAEGGYVASSTTNLGAGAPYGEVVLRIPVARFEDAVTKAQELGKTVTLTRSADDVTGKYVDLSARMHALEHTRATYLAIESRARTIGATLAVQQRIDDVQQQIDRLHGQLKLLGNQSSYSTLTVDVVPPGLATHTLVHHNRHGIGKAWHDSWSRFNRGVNAIVGAIGPIVFALLLLGVVALLGLLGHRAARRVLGTAAAK